MNCILNKRILLLLTLIVGYGINSFAQSVSNKGKEFWVSYGHHQQMTAGGGSMDMVLYLCTDNQAAVVDVEIIGPGNQAIPSTIWRRRYNVPANTAISTGTTMPQAISPGGTTTAGMNNPAAPSPMPKSGAYDCRLYSDPPPVGWGGAGTYKRAIKITSNVPIVAYAHIYVSTNSGATMLLPVDAWGYSYTSLNSKQNYSSDCYNWTYIIAKENDTKVEITPSVVTRAQDKTGLQPGVTSVITLNKGDVYQLVGANDAADANGNGGTSAAGKNLSGTKIQSIPGVDGKCKQIAVFAGSSRTSNPASCGAGGGDSDNQQLFPQHTWGTEYLTTPFSGNTTLPAYATCTYKIAVSDPTTVVKVNGVTLTGLQNNNFYSYESSTPDRIEADKPIMVCEFMTGGGCIPGPDGDPEMVILSPKRQAIKRTIFYRNNLTAIDVNYLSLVIPTAGLTSLKIDNSSSFDFVSPHPNKPGYSIVVKKWGATAGQSIAISDSAFTGIMYGLGSVESYGYNAGTNLDPYKIPSGSHNIPDTSSTNVSHPYGFVGIPMYIGAQFPYKPIKIVWKLTQITPAVALAVNPPPLTDVVQMLPTPVDSIFTSGIGWTYLYRLPGLYTFPTPGIYTVPIELTAPNPTFGNACNTDNKEDVFMDIEIKVKPSATFTFTPTTGCNVVNAINFNSPTQTPEGLNVIKYQWYFSSNPNDTSSQQNPVFTYASPGTYNVKLVIITEYGGIDSISKTVTATAGARPHSPYTASLDTLCLGQTVTFTPTSNVVGTTGWYWNFDNGTTVTETTNTAKTITYTTAGTYQVKHSILGSGSSFPCLADTVVKTIVVAVTPAIASSSGTAPTTCNGTDGYIELTGLENNTTYTVNYTLAGNPVTVSLTSNASGVLTIPNLSIGSYTNISVKIGNCTSNVVASITIQNPSSPATPTASSNSPICQNGTLNLTASTTTTGTINYVWTGPNGFASTDQNPTINNVTTATGGTYSVVAIKDNCSSTAGTVNVTIIATPIIGSTTKTNPSACTVADGSIKLNGLTPSTAYGVEYIINGTTKTATITSNSSGEITITGLAAGTYSDISVSIGTCKSASVGPINLVDPNPPATPVITTNSPVCSGTTLNLSATSATSGVTFNWSGPNSFTATGASATVNNTTVTNGGVYSVTATLNGCVSAAGTATAVIKQTPVISSSNGINPINCGSATGKIELGGLTANTAYTVIYLVNTTPTSITLTSNGSGTVTIPSLAAGTYSGVTVSLNGCTSAPVGPFNLTDPNPPATPTASANSPLCNGSKLNLTASSTTAGVTYH
ncbi:MAG: PKD domain-containing protein, partial [Chitinophagaceae bacterium]|nr:PKD domain-containing protein [Chitinophagaceae bacterium]